MKITNRCSRVFVFGWKLQQNRTSDGPGDRGVHGGGSVVADGATRVEPTEIEQSPVLNVEIK